MALSGWHTYNYSLTKCCPDTLGIYELVDEDKIVYYYGYGNIRTKLLEHLKKNEFPLVKYFRFEEFEAEEECVLREQELLVSYQEKHKILPLYNERYLDLM
jgi:hypothetical protein